MTHATDWTRLEHIEEQFWHEVGERAAARLAQADVWKDAPYIELALTNLLTDGRQL